MAATPGLVGHTAQVKGYNKEIQALTGTTSSYQLLSIAHYADGDTGTWGGQPSPVSGLKGSPALTCQKWFTPANTYYKTQSALPSNMTDLINQGCAIILCIKPGSSAKPFVKTTTDGANLTATVEALAAYCAAQGAPPPWVVLNSEANGGGDFPTASSYISWYNYYAPYVENATGTGIPPGGIPVGVDWATATSLNGNYQAYYPGDAHVHFVAADFYGNSYQNGGERLDSAFGAATISMMAQADNNAVLGPVPFGLFEWGISSFNTSNPLTSAQWKSFYQYVAGVFNTRLANGKANAPVCWYSGTDYPEQNLLDGTQTGEVGYSLIAGLNYVHSQLSATGVPLADVAAAGPGHINIHGRLAEPASAAETFSVQQGGGGSFVPEPDAAAAADSLAVSLLQAVQPGTDAAAAADAITVNRPPTPPWVLPIVPGSGTATSFDTPANDLAAANVQAGQQFMIYDAQGHPVVNEQFTVQSP